MNLKHLGDSIKHAVLEEEEPAPSQPVATPTPIASTPYISTPIPSTFTTPPTETPQATGTDAGIAQFLQALKDKTDFDQTPVGQQLAEHMAPVADLPISDAQKLGVAIKAGAKDGLTKEKILDTLQGLSSVLVAEKNAFNASADRMMTAEVDSRKQQIQAEADKQEDLKRQIAASQQVQTELTSAMIDAQGSIQRKQAQFQAAYDSRSIDLTAAISKYTSLLQG